MKTTICALLALALVAPAFAEEYDSKYYGSKAEQDQCRSDSTQWLWTNKPIPKDQLYQPPVTPPPTPPPPPPEPRVPTEEDYLHALDMVTEHLDKSIGRDIYLNHLASMAARDYITRLLEIKSISLKQWFRLHDDISASYLKLTEQRQAPRNTLTQEQRNSRVLHDINVQLEKINRNIQIYGYR